MRKFKSNPERRGLLKAGVVLVTLMILGTTQYLSVNLIKPFEIRSLLPSDDPVRLKYESYLKHHDNRRNITLLVKTNMDQRNSALLWEYNQYIYTKLFNLAYLDKISVMTESEYLTYNETDEFKFRLFFNDRTLRQSGREHLGQKPFHFTFLNEAGNSFLVHLARDEYADTADETRLIEQLLTLAGGFEERFADTEVHLLGYGVARYFYMQEVLRNQSMVAPLVLLIIALILGLMFRSLVTVALSLYVIIMTYCVNLVVILLNESGISPYSGFALVFVLIIATADIVHYFSMFHRIDGSLEDKINKTKEAIIRPCFYTTLTTAICFTTLLVNTSLPVQNLGIYCAAGSIICFISTFWVLPILLRIFVGEKSIYIYQWHNRVSGYPEFLVNHRKVVVFAVVMVSLFCLIPAFSLKIDDNFYNRFVQSHPLSLSTKQFISEFNSLTPVEFVLKPKDPGNFPSVQHEKKLAQIHERLSDIDEIVDVKSVYSFLDYMRFNVPDGSSFLDSGKLHNILELFKNRGITESFLSEDNSRLLFQVSTNSFSAMRLSSLFSRFREVMDELHVKDLFTYEVGGFSGIRLYIVNQIKNDLILSLSLSFLLIFLIFIMIFRSFLLSMVAMIPNLLPLLVLAGLMSLVGIVIEDNLVILLTVVLGIAVDDTIHFLSAYQEAQRSGLRGYEAVNRAFRKSAPALIGTTAILTVTVPCFALMNLTLFVQIAFFLVLTFVLALILDLYFLPLILSKGVSVDDRSRDCLNEKLR